MSKQDLILLYGGRSAEREVSVLSGRKRDARDWFHQAPILLRSQEISSDASF